jgi:hypothetical protein
MTPTLSPLQLDQLSRDLWQLYDPLVIAQLAPLAEDQCYQIKTYRAPDLANEVFAAGSYLPYGLRITPGSLIYGFYLPVNPSTLLPPSFNVQITDLALKHKFWFSQIPSLFLSNLKTTCLSPVATQQGVFPSLLPYVHPVVGDGLLKVEIWETAGVQQRIELVLGVLEVVG